MKKLFTLMLAALFAIPVIKAQESTFNMDDKVVSLGIGIGRTFGTGLYTTGRVPPVSISYEQAVVEDVLEKGVIGVGGYLAYSSYRYEYALFGSEWGWNYTNIIAAAQGAFHYPLVDKLDTYAGVLLGYRISTSSEFGDVPSGSSSASGGIVFSGYLGGRYYFTDNLAGFVQVGYGIAYLTLGISFKL